MNKFLTGLARILTFLIIFAFTLPILLLPLTTSVPSWVWIPLGIVDIVLLVLQFRITAMQRGITMSLAGTLLVFGLAVVASQAFASTPAITDASGDEIPGSIATLEKVNLNGSEQWITIRGHDVSKPILLNLGMGGPGGGGFATRSLFEPLEKDFIVVSWDEPGTGKSMNAVPFESLNRERFVEDAHALTLYLRERFDEKKIYVYGVSWTSILGIWLVQKYPEEYYAYIGNGQMVNVIRDDVMGYELALQYSGERSDTQSVEILQRNGPPPYYGDDMLDKYVFYLDILNDYMGSPRYTLVVPIVPFLAPEYGYVDKVNHTRGLMRSFEAVYPQLQGLDFTTQATQLDVPVYIFAGREDVNAMSSLVEEYVAVLDAPHKQLIWLNGGHGLDGNNIGQFKDVIVNQILPETYTTER